MADAAADGELVDAPDEEPDDTGGRNPTLELEAMLDAGEVAMEDAPELIVEPPSGTGVTLPDCDATDGVAVITLAEDEVEAAALFTPNPTRLPS